MSGVPKTQRHAKSSQSAKTTHYITVAPQVLLTYIFPTEQLNMSAGRTLKL